MLRMSAGPRLPHPAARRGRPSRCAIWPRRPGSRHRRRAREGIFVLCAPLYCSALAHSDGFMQHSETESSITEPIFPLPSSHSSLFLRALGFPVSRSDPRTSITTTRQSGRGSGQSTLRVPRDHTTHDTPERRDDSDALAGPSQPPQPPRASLTALPAGPHRTAPTCERHPQPNKYKRTHTPVWTYRYMPVSDSVTYGLRLR